MAAADRRPQGQANEARPVPALEPGPRVRAWQELANLHGRRKVPVKRREAGQEAVTGREQRGSGSGNGAASDPARPARRGAALRAVISLATRPARGDNGPPNRRSREIGVVTPTNGRGPPEAAC